MAFEFKLPDIGEGVVEGEIVKWLVKPGDSVAEDQPMVEVMTDKATVVIPSPKAGKILETRGKEGDIAKVHEVLVVIEERGAATARPAPAPSVPSAPPTKTAPPARPAPTPAAQERPAAAQHEVSRGNGSAAEPSGSRVLAAPATRRLARELGVNLGRIEGTGPAGRVTSEDVKLAAQHAPTLIPAIVETAPPTQALVRPPPVRAPVGQAVPAKGLRKRIWENMARSKAMAAHFTFVEECDTTNLVATRERFNKQLADGENQLSYLPFIVKAVVAALKRYPDLNGHIDEPSMSFTPSGEYHLGIATSTERGLIVPVVRNADRRSLLELSAEIRRVAELARAGRLGPEDLGGSTFTITSLGKQGGIFATPIINYPEVAIMGVHKMVKRPVVIDDQIQIREMMNLSLSFDHRWIDGHVGAAFTYAVIHLLEAPDRLLLEMS
jgi:pyruvate dehydrogenase E2 component (dihydrolipoamide acetyltransferase)